MAIDTERKRRSIYQIPGLMMLPTADGSINAGDRTICSWLYPQDLTRLGADVCIFSLCVEKSRYFDMYVDESRAMELCVEKSRRFNLEL